MKRAQGSTLAEFRGVCPPAGSTHRPCSCAVSSVHDGYVLRNSVVSSPVGGRLLDECLQASLASKDITLQPWYLYSKTSKGAGVMSAKAREAAGITASHASWATSFLVADMKENICRFVV